VSQGITPWISLVHLAFSWVEIQSTAVEQHGYFEILDVAISSRPTFDRNDLTVDTVGHRSGDPVRTVRHNAIDWLLKTPCEFFHRCHLGTNDSLIPVSEVALGLPLGLLKKTGDRPRPVSLGNACFVCVVDGPFDPQNRLRLGNPPFCPIPLLLHWT
jgi:hypothetical protein